MYLCVLGSVALGVTSGRAQPTAKHQEAAAVLADVIAAVPEARGPDGKPTPTTIDNVAARVRLLAETNAKQQRALRQAQLATLQLQEALRE